MARRHRRDRSGAKYHVMNRGVARRTIFDARSDYRFFLACLARAVHREEIEVLGYALMRTHFHLYVRSLGGLSEAMRRVQQRHSRRFNRMHRRDGPLLRGRFLSLRVRTPSYSRNVVRYLHDNPIAAGLCDRPEDYEWSSARVLAGLRTPIWFDDGEVRSHGMVDGRIPLTSAAVMHARADLVEARLRAPPSAKDDQLDGATPEKVLAWMHRKATLADGVRTSLPEVGPQTLATVVRHEFPEAARSVTPVPGARTYRTLDLLLAGLLRDASCCGFPEIAGILEVDLSRARRLHRLHWRCIVHSPPYAELAVAVVMHCKTILERED